jgi:hypothetical protein
MIEMIYQMKNLKSFAANAENKNAEAGALLECIGTISSHKASKCRWGIFSAYRSADNDLWYRHALRCKVEKV